MAILENVTNETYRSVAYDWSWTKGSATVPDTYTRRFRDGTRRPKPAVLTPTPYTAYFEELVYPYGHMENGAPPWRYTTDGGYHFPTTGHNVRSCDQMDASPDLRSLAYLRALAQLNGRHIDLGAALVESGETALS